LSVARGLRRRLCAAAGRPAQTGQPGFGGPWRGTKQKRIDEELLVRYVVPFLPCAPAERASASECEDLPLTANGVLQSSFCAIWQIVATHVGFVLFEKSHKFVLLLLLFFRIVTKA